jgi:hypothetical protein
MPAAGLWMNRALRHAAMATKVFVDTTNTFVVQSLP